MNRLLIPLVALLALTACRPAHKGPALTFYVQLVQGSDDDAPPSLGSHPVGVRLEKKLSSTFRWKHYWELKREAVVVPPGNAVRRQLAPGRSVELDLLDADTMAVRVYSQGRPVRCRKQPVANALYITGGNLGPSRSWFIVVRRDEPQVPAP
jgi:hypothetical protein